MTGHRTLVAEHAILLAQVAARVRAVQGAAQRSRWPASELKELLDYVRSEVLSQAADEEWRLFPAGTASVARLSRDHARLRVATEVLTRAATGEGRRSARQVAAIARALLAQLQDHVIAEDNLLCMRAGRPTAKPEAVARYPHEWYDVTHAPVIDLDALPAEVAVDAVTDRVLRLERGEQVDVTSAKELDALWQRLNRLAPGVYGFVLRDDGPQTWTLRIKRR